MSEVKALRQPRVGDDVLYHFECRGGVRSRPAKIVLATLGKQFVNLVAYYDGPNDGRHMSDLVGWHDNVRPLPEGSNALANTWSYRAEEFVASEVVGVLPGRQRP